MQRLDKVLAQPLTVYGKWKFSRRSRPDTGYYYYYYYYAQPEAEPWRSLVSLLFAMSTFTPGQIEATQLFDFYLHSSEKKKRSTKPKVMFICKAISFPFLYLFSNPDQQHTSFRLLGGEDELGTREGACSANGPPSQYKNEKVPVVF